MRHGTLFVPGLAALLLVALANRALATSPAPTALTPGTPIEREVAVGAVDAY
jgi:hypothetical protein